MILSKSSDEKKLASSIVEPEHSEKSPVRVPSKHIIPAESIIINKELGTGEFGTVQQGVWTNDDNRVRYSPFTWAKLNNFYNIPVMIIVSQF